MLMLKMFKIKPVDTVPFFKNWTTKLHKAQRKLMTVLANNVTTIFVLPK